MMEGSCTDLGIEGKDEERGIRIYSSRGKEDYFLNYQRKVSTHGEEDKWKTAVCCCELERHKRFYVSSPNSSFWEVSIDGFSERQKGEKITEEEKQEIKRYIEGIAKLSGYLVRFPHWF